MIALFLAVMMTVSLTACGNSKDETTAAPAETTTAAAETTTAPAESATAAPETTEAPSEEETSAPAASTDGTLGETLKQVFLDQMTADPAIGAQALADAIITHESILFGGGSVPVEPGLLTGFDNAEITGFSEGIMIAPMIGTIPFVGYVFVLEDGADVDAFKTTLEENANPRWNICTAAEETVIESIDNTVFFLMCPMSLEG